MTESKGLQHPLIHFFHRALHSPFGLQCVTLTFFMIFILGFRPSLFGESGSLAYEYQKRLLQAFPISDEGFFRNDIGVDTSGLREVIEINEKGEKIRKIVSQKREAEVDYIIKTGDNISTIAHKFGLKVSTLLWANKLSAKETITPGKSLVIPPVDGIYYKVESKDTLGEIAKVYEADIEKIRHYNQLKGDQIRPGQNIFIPDAKKIAQIPGKRIPQFMAGDTSSVSLDLGSLNIIRPTKGSLTQGFHDGHFAIDIANVLNTPIYAAAGGKVRKVGVGGWNYGYGNYLIIDHGNGIETLYGHTNVVKVSEGDEVKAGQLIALMGNTGRVFGPTGIHLHFELRIKGRKVDPSYYFR